MVCGPATFVSCAPTGAIMRMLSRVSRNVRPKRLAMPEPINKAGSSGPIGLPVPIETVLQMNFQVTPLNGT